MNHHKHFCFCWLAQAQDWLKDRFYDKETHKYKHAWVLYLGVSIYILHWLWHIAVGAMVISFVYRWVL
ncbi:MAG: hypothetical protein HUK06_06235 [Bacteroidaceae bacterium]|nr:hypothetical protein [Bacteroidaceae bacterium]